MVSLAVKRDKHRLCISRSQVTSPGSVALESSCGAQCPLFMGVKHSLSPEGVQTRLKSRDVNNLWLLDLSTGNLSFVNKLRYGV